MFRRFLRWFALALFALCIVVWVGSYWRDVGVMYVPRTTAYTLDINCGRVLFTKFDGSAPTRHHWYVSERLAQDWAYRDTRLVTFELLGFSFSHDNNSFTATLPLWFLTAISGTLVFFLWRKPRRKGGGFPVEAKEKEFTPS